MDTKNADTGFEGATVHERLGEGFFDPVVPARFPEAILRYRNQRWAQRMGLDGLDDTQWIDHFARFSPLPGSFTTPLALRYHGHQFGTYNPDLGDGRGFLFAQGYDLSDGALRDFGTKGSGKTPWSRGGDGRLTLKGGVRELLATEMLEALGVNTSRTFSLIETGEALVRGDEPSPTRSSVLVRLSCSHIRIGTFQRLDHLNDRAGLARLAEHTIAHYYPGLADLPGPARIPALLGAIAENVAKTGAQWIAAGFVHGVLNSDNINVTGESFDYGPWRFLPAYDPGFTAAYFDDTGFYAFGRQPDALAWNLTRLAECLVPLAPIAALEPELNRFWPAFQNALAEAMRDRLGLAPRDAETQGELVSTLFTILNASRAPYEQVFFDWFGGMASQKRAAQSPLAGLYDSPAFAPLRALLANAPPAPDADLAHPYFARAHPVTMLIEDVEALWAPIAEHDDWRPLHAALAGIAEMAQALRTTPLTTN